MTFSRDMSSIMLYTGSECPTNEIDASYGKLGRLARLTSMKIEKS